MKSVRTVGLAGLVLAAAALPVTAYALSSSDGPGTPPATVQPAADDASEPADPEDTAEAPATAETDAPDAAETGQPNPASTAGRDHAAAMKAWARCVAEAASGPKTAGSPRPPKLACGEKPMGPGRAKHLAAGGVTPGSSGHPKTHGKSGAHGH
jgi:hypothetical protein